MHIQVVTHVSMSACRSFHYYHSVFHSHIYIRRRMRLPVLERNLGIGMCPCSFKQTRTKLEHIHKNTKWLEFESCLFRWVNWCIPSALKGTITSSKLQNFTVFFFCYYWVLPWFLNVILETNSTKIVVCRNWSMFNLIVFEDTENALRNNMLSSYDMSCQKLCQKAEVCAPFMRFSFFRLLSLAFYFHLHLLIRLKKQSKKENRIRKRLWFE